MTSDDLPMAKTMEALDVKRDLFENLRGFTEAYIHACVEYDKVEDESQNLGW